MNEFTYFLSTSSILTYDDVCYFSKYKAKLIFHHIISFGDYFVNSNWLTVFTISQTHNNIKLLV